MYKIIVKKDKLFMAIARLNLSQSEFAKKIGVHPMHLCLLRNKRGCPSPATRQKILNGFGGKYEFDDLFYLSKDNQESSEIIKS